MSKQEVREIARRAHLPVAEKPESQEICFVPSGDYAQFIEAYRAEQGLGRTPRTPARRRRASWLPPPARCSASHTGVHHFTIGQRRGLGIAAGRPLYVVQIDPASRRVTVGSEDELRRDACDVRDVNWIAWEAPAKPVEARSRSVTATSPRRPWSSLVGRQPVHRLRFREPQRAITPGQAAVFYSGEQVLGGGWISAGRGNAARNADFG